MSVPSQRDEGARYLVAVLVCFVAVVMLGALAIGTVAASEHITVEREGSSLNVTVDKSVYGVENVSKAPTKKAKIEIKGTNRSLSLQGDSDAGEYTGTIALTRFSSVGGDLSQATVTVRANGTAASAKLDLRYLEKKKNGKVVKRHIELPINRSMTVGVPTGEIPVLVKTPDTETTLQGNLTRDSIDVPVRSLQTKNIDTTRKLDFQPLPNGPVSLSYEVSLQNTVDTDLYYTDPLVLSHPWLFKGERYVVEVDGPAIYRDTTKVESDGNITLPTSIIYADSFSIRVTKAGGADVFNLSRDDLVNSEPIKGHWNNNKTAVIINDSSKLPEGLSELWVRHDGTVRPLQASTLRRPAGKLNGSALQDTTGIRPGEPFDVLLVGDTTQVLVVTSTGSSADQGGQKSREIEKAARETQDQESDLKILLVALLVAVGGGSITGLWAKKWARGASPTFVGLLFAIVVGTVGTGHWFADTDLLLTVAYVVAAGAFGMWSLGMWSLAASRSNNSGVLFPLGVTLIADVLLMGVVIGGFLVSEQLGSGYGRSIVLGGVNGILGGIVLLTYVQMASVDESDSTASHQAGRPTQMYRTQVIVKDGTGSTLRENITVELQPRGGEPKPVDVNSGTATVDLEQGEWAVRASYGNEEATTPFKRITRRNQRLVVEFDGRDVQIEVRDRKTGSRIEGATLEIVTGGEARTVQTDQRGKWSTTLPVTVDSLSVTASHNRYESEQKTITLGDQSPDRVELRPLLGTIEATVVTGGEPVPDVSVEAVPQRDGADRREGVTDSNGKVRFEEIPVGTYAVQPRLADAPPQFSVDGARINLRDEMTEHERFRVQYEFALSSEQQRRIRELQTSFADIADVSRRDGAIPSYFASVLRSILDTVKRVAEKPRLFLTNGVDPDEVTDALLSAVEEATSMVGEAMNSKRNVDLFSACADMREVSVEWSGTVTLEHLIELAQKDIGQQRGEIIDRIEAVDDRISSEMGQLGEISPARETWEKARTLVRNQGSGSNVRSAATVVTVEALLDAIEKMFEQRELRNRMEQTVF